MTESRKPDDEVDDLELDASLSTMRSMWRELPDEEPSDRGMVALLSAARAKAEEMKPKASWWSRVLEQLRRPPVLALATVVVLIGGAVVISQRDTRTEAELAEPASPAPAPTAASPAAPEPMADDRATALPRPVVGASAANETANQATAVEGAKHEQAASTVPGDGTPGGARLDTGAGSAAPGPQVAQRPRPPVRAPQRPRGGAEEGGLDNMKWSETDAEAAPAQDPASERDEKKSVAPAEIATTDVEPHATGSTATSGAAPVERKPVARQPLPAIEGEDRTAPDTTIAQLVKQCEAAAAKNDCVSVRTIAQKIAAKDPQLYRTRVVKNANVARCLE